MSNPPAAPNTASQNENDSNPKPININLEKSVQLATKFRRVALDFIMFVFVLVFVCLLSISNLSNGVYDFQSNVPRVGQLYTVEPFHNWKAVSDEINSATTSRLCAKNSDNTTTVDAATCVAWTTLWNRYALLSTCDQVDSALWPSGCTCLQDIVGKMADASDTAQAALTVAQRKQYDKALLGCMHRGQMPSSVYYKEPVNMWNQLLLLFGIATVLNIATLNWSERYETMEGHYGYKKEVQQDSANMLFNTIGSFIVGGTFLALYIVCATYTNSLMNDGMLLLVHIIMFFAHLLTYRAIVHILETTVVKNNNTTLYQERVKIITFKNNYILGWFICHSIPQYAIILAILRGWLDIEMLYFIITISFFIGNFILCSMIFRWYVAEMFDSKMVTHAESYQKVTYFTLFILILAIAGYAWTNLPLLVPGGNELYVLLSIAYIVFLLLIIFNADIINGGNSQLDISDFFQMCLDVETTLRVLFFVTFCFIYWTRDL